MVRNLIHGYPYLWGGVCSKIGKNKFQGLHMSQAYKLGGVKMKTIWVWVWGIVGSHIGSRWALNIVWDL